MIEVIRKYPSGTHGIEEQDALCVYHFPPQPLSSIMMCLQQFERARNLHIRLILLHVISVRLRKAEEGERGKQRGVGGKMH